jgi:putative heme-binding domain-containing protein
MDLGREVYSRESHCATCHQPHGQGLPNLYPPLDGSVWATGSEERLIRMVLDGMHGTIEVKGKRYSSPPLPPMTGFRHLLTDQEIAAVITYVRNSWTNRAKPVNAKMVADVRAIDRGEDAAFWSANELIRKYPLEDGTQPIEDTTPEGWIPKLVQEWTLGDFSDAQLAAKGRSFESGQAAFNKIGCAQCHKLGESGGVFGPNLAELDVKKQTAEYVLQSILDPSKDVEEKYAMRTYLIDSGQVISGFVVKETDEELHLKADPLNKEEVTVIRKDEIETQSINAKSVMPMGLLNWLQKEEVLDLITYVLAAGDAQHALYSK